MRECADLKSGNAQRGRLGGREAELLVWELVWIEEKRRDAERKMHRTEPEKLSGTVD